jgi:hypothetical protein
MRFYYFSLFGTLLALTVSQFAAGAFWAIWRGALKQKLPAWAFLLSLPIFLVLPWIEELWIAFNFAQFCRKDAGLSINKTAEVDGFYDDTTHWWRQLKESTNYRFVESRDIVTGTLWRVEREGNGVKHFRIEKPTARYHFLMDSGVRPAFKIGRQSSTILDTEAKANLAQYTRYHREAPWFFIGFGRPNIGCDGPGDGINSNHGFLIYRDVLKPATR